MSIELKKDDFTAVEYLQGKSAAKVAELYLHETFGDDGKPKADLDKHAMWLMARHAGYNAWNNENFNEYRKERWALLVNAMLGGDLTRLQWFAERDPEKKRKLYEKLELREMLETRDRVKFTIVNPLKGKTAAYVAVMYLEAMNREKPGDDGSLVADPDKHAMSMMTRHAGYNAWNNPNYTEHKQKGRWELLVNAMLGGDRKQIKLFADSLHDPKAKRKLEDMLDTGDPEYVQGKKTIFRPWFTCAHTGKKYYAADYGHKAFAMKVDK